jgi:hypothetical protein
MRLESLTNRDFLLILHSILVVIGPPGVDTINRDNNSLDNGIVHHNSVATWNMKHEQERQLTS